MYPAYWKLACYTVPRSQNLQWSLYISGFPNLLILLILVFYNVTYFDFIIFTF